MSRLTPALETELRQDAPLVFGALAIDLPSYNLSLLDGAGILSFDGRTYVGEDATFGTLSDIEELEDGTGDSAPAIAIGLLPSGDAAAAALAGPAMQGSRVAVYFGARNAITGQVVGTELVFLGELDVPTLQAGDRGRRLDYEVVSVFERLFEDDESARLSPGHHRSIFPNEAGMDYVTGVDQPVYWGVAGNPSPVVTGSGGVNYSLGSYLANK